MEILILILIGLAVFGAVRYMKKHKSTCGGNCAGCGMDCDRRK